ncbi:hypothetical protein ABK040_002916 [Willaertia magna]
MFYGNFNPNNNNNKVERERRSANVTQQRRMNQQYNNQDIQQLINKQEMIFTPLIQDNANNHTQTQFMQIIDNSQQQQVVSWLRDQFIENQLSAFYNNDKLLGPNSIQESSSQSIPYSSLGLKLDIEDFVQSLHAMEEEQRNSRINRVESVTFVPQQQQSSSLLNNDQQPPTLNLSEPLNLSQKSTDNPNTEKDTILGNCTKKSGKIRKKRKTGIGVRNKYETISTYDPCNNNEGSENCWTFHYMNEKQSNSAPKSPNNGNNAPNGSTEGSNFTFHCFFPKK